MQWNDNYVREVERTVGQRVQASAYHLLSRVRENISVSGRTIRHEIGPSGKVNKILGPYGSAASRPGEFPRKQRGTLRQSIAQQYDAETLTARVGSVLKYARFLEFGTSRMAARPFLRRTLAEERETIRQTITFGGASDIKVS